MKYLVFLWAWITNRTRLLVWLCDSNGAVTLSLAWRNEFNQIVAERFPFFNIYKVVLLKDGRVRSYSTTCFVQFWKPFERL